MSVSFCVYNKGMYRQHRLHYSGATTNRDIGNDECVYIFYIHNVQWKIINDNKRNKSSNNTYIGYRRGGLHVSSRQRSCSVGPEIQPRVRNLLRTLTIYAYNKNLHLFCHRFNFWILWSINYTIAFLLHAISSFCNNTTSCTYKVDLSYVITSLEADLAVTMTS